MNHPEVLRLEKELMNLSKELADTRKKYTSRKLKNFELTIPGGSIMLTDLFGGKSDLLLIHNMGVSCAYCTAYADGINGVLGQLESRTAVALVSNDAPEIQRSFGQQRGWKFNMASIRHTSFSKELGYEPNVGEFWPGIMGLKNNGGEVTLVSQAFFDPGDNFCVIWPLLAFLEDGVGAWEPKISKTGICSC